MTTANDYVKSLGLQPHPEGGYFKETYRSTGTIPAASLPEGFTGDRHFSTAIYFLIEAGNFSALHRIKSDELWHFYAGDALEVIELHDDGTLKITAVGANTANGEVFQYMVPAGCWFGSRVRKGGTFSLVGCTVAPGFDFADFEMGNRDQLRQQFPQHEKVIGELTRL